MEVINAAVQVMVFMALGFMSRRLKWTNADTVGPMTKIVLNIALPCLIVNSMVIPFEQEKLNQGFLSLAMVVLLLVCFGLCGLLWARLLKPHDRQKNAVLRMFFLFNNFMLIGVPIIEAVFGSEGVFYTGLMGLPQRAIMFMVLPLAYGSVAEGEYHTEFSWRLLLQMPSIAVFVGLFMFVAQIQIPGVIRGCLSSLGGMAMPLGMMMAGMQLADVDLRRLFRDWTLPVALLIKNMLHPLIALVLLRSLGFPTLLVQLGVIFAAVPAPAMMVVYAANYRVQPGYAGANMFLSTLCSAVTLPFWSYIVTTVVF